MLLGLVIVFLGRAKDKEKKKINGHQNNLGVLIWFFYIVIALAQIGAAIVCTYVSFVSTFSGPMTKTLTAMAHHWIWDVSVDFYIKVANFYKF